MKTIDEQIAKLQWRIERQYGIIERHQNEIKANYKRLEKYKSEIQALQTLKNVKALQLSTQG